MKTWKSFVDWCEGVIGDASNKTLGAILTLLFLLAFIYIYLGVDRLFDVVKIVQTVFN